MKSAWTIGNEGIAYSVESSECYGDRQESVHHDVVAVKVYVIAVKSVGVRWMVWIFNAVAVAE